MLAFYTVLTDSGGQLFSDRLNQAMKVLDEAKGLKDKCPAYWTDQMDAAQGLGLNKTQFNDIFQQAINYESDFFHFYRVRAVYLMPRWYGGEGELEADLEKSADKLGGDDGDVLYARVVWGIHGNSSSDNIFK